MNAGNDGFTATSTSRRLFVRQIPTNLAAFPLTPQPTELALPDAYLQEAHYREALARMGTVMPLQVAVLRDQLDRVRTAQERFHAVRTEELTWLQLANEDARQAEETIEQRLTQLREQRTQQENTDRTEIERLTALRAEARLAVTAAFAAAGLELKGLKAELSDPEEEAPAASVLPAVPVVLPEAVAVEGAAASLSVTTPPLSRWRSFLHGRVGVMVPPLSTTSEPSPSTTDTPSPEQLPDRITSQLRPEDTEQRAAPPLVLGMQKGIPISTTARAQLHTAQRWIEWPALVVCGMLFGLSLGLLIGILDFQRLLRRPEEVGISAFIVSLLGIAIFWVLGRLSHLGIALASESWHSVAFTKGRQDANELERILIVTARGTLVLTVLFVLSLIYIESQVELHGVLGGLLEKTVNARLMRSGSGAAGGTPNQGVLLALATVVSAPFLLLHALQGWIEGKTGAQERFLEALAAEEGWKVQQALLTQREEELSAINLDLLTYRREALKRLADYHRLQDEQRIGTTGEAQAPEPLLLPPPSGELEVSFVAPLNQSLRCDDGFLRLSADHPWPLGTIAAAMVALAQVRELHAQVRRAQAQKREHLEALDREIGRWEAQRVMEKTEVSLESRQRIDAAFAAYTKAAAAFDRLFQQELQHYEKRTRPGLFWRLRDFFISRPDPKLS